MYCALIVYLYTTYKFQSVLCYMCSSKSKNVKIKIPSQFKQYETSGTIYYISLVLETNHKNLQSQAFRQVLLTNTHAFN